MRFKRQYILLTHCTEATMFAAMINFCLKPKDLPINRKIVQLTAQEIREMAIPTKIQITCKISEVPPFRELPSKELEFFLADGERVLTVRMKARLFNKLTNHGFHKWVAVISGELGPATETGCELVNPSLQVFEKKPRGDAEPASQKIQQSASVHPPLQGVNLSRRQRSNRKNGSAKIYCLGSG
jgi:hypothetical protein